MLFSRFLSDLVSTLEMRERDDVVVHLKHGSTGNVSFTLLYLAKLNLLLSAYAWKHWSLVLQKFPYSMIPPAQS